MLQIFGASNRAKVEAHPAFAPACLQSFGGPAIVDSDRRACPRLAGLSFHAGPDGSSGPAFLWAKRDLHDPKLGVERPMRSGASSAARAATKPPVLVPTPVDSCSGAGR